VQAGVTNSPKKYSMSLNHLKTHINLYFIQILISYTTVNVV